MGNAEWTPAVWLDEVALIKIAAAKYGLDWHFIAAIRKTENGRPGREFGVLSERANNYSDQLRICCITVRHRMAEYAAAHAGAIELYEPPDEEKVLAYSRKFIDWFASIWAPAGVGNDPHNLNRNWPRNCAYWYHHLIDLEHPA